MASFFPGVPVPTALPLVCLGKAVELSECWQDDGGESEREPPGTGTALVAAQFVGNGINAHLSFTGTDASPSETLPGA